MDYSSIIYLSSILPTFSTICVNDEFQLTLNTKKEIETFIRSDEIRLTTEKQKLRRMQQMGISVNEISVVKLQNYNYSLRHLRKICFGLGLDTQGNKKLLTERIMCNRAHLQALAKQQIFT